MSRAATRIILTAFLVWSLIAGGIPSPGSAAALQPGQIGLRLQTAPPEKGPGAIVVAVIPGSSAAEEKIRVGEIVREVAQEEVSSVEEAVDHLQREFRAGKTTVLLLIERQDGDLRFVAVRFSTGEATAEASPAAPAPFLRLQTAPPGKGPGAIILEVAPGSPAAAEDLRVGDIVRQVGQDENISTGEEAVARIQEEFRTGKKSVLLLMDREGDERFVAMLLPSGGTTAGVASVPSAPVATAAPRPATTPAQSAAAPTPSPAPPSPVAAAPRPAKPEPPREIAALGLWLEAGSQANGVMVTSVSTVGRAARAGIRAGDVITSIDHVAMHSADDVIRQIGIGAPSLYASFSLLRNGHRADETVVQVRDPPPTVVSAPAAPPKPAAVTAAPPAAASRPAASPAPVAELSPEQGGWNVNLTFDFSISAVFSGFFKNTPSWIYILSILFGLLMHQNTFLGIGAAIFVFFNVSVNFSIIQGGGFIEYLYRPFYLWFVAPFLAIFNAFDTSTAASGLALLALCPLLSLILYGGALAYVGPEVRQQEWERMARYLPRGLSQFLGGRPAASAEVIGVPADAEEEEIALARRAVWPAPLEVVHPTCRLWLRRPAKMNSLSGPTRTGCTAQIERAVR